MIKPKQPRKELTSLRLEPQVKYLAEIASRVQRRSLTNFIEWVLEESIKNMKLRDDPKDNRTIGDLSFLLWDTSESERLINLALIAPELLTHDEQLIFKVMINTQFKFLSDPSLTVIKDNSGNYAASYGRNNFPEALTIEDFDISKINLFWDDIVKASEDDGEAINKLEQQKNRLEKQRKKAPDTDQFSPYDDDVPF